MIEGSSNGSYYYYRRGLGQGRFRTAGVVGVSPPGGLVALVHTAEPTGTAAVSRLTRLPWWSGSRTWMTVEVLDGRRVAASDRRGAG